MSLSGSMFLVEIIISELRSCVKSKEFIIKSQFADVFSIILKDPQDFENALPKKKRLRRKNKLNKNIRPQSKREYKVQSGQSILFGDNVDNLICNMKTYPIELSFWSKMYPKYKIASTTIPWNVKYIDYLKKVEVIQQLEPVSMTGEYNVFDEVTSRRMAVIKLNIKLSYLADKISTQFRSLSEEAPDTFLYTGFNSKPSTVLSTIQDKSFNIAEETGIIKTIYSGGKKKTKKSSHNKSKLSKGVKEVHEEPVSKLNTEKKQEIINSKKVNSSIVSLIKSDTDIDKGKQLDLIKSKSCSSMNQDQLNILNYIFGDNTGPFGNQIYCVSYFTVENDNNHNSSPKTSEIADTTDKSSTKDQSNKTDTGSRRLSFISLDLPDDIAANVSNIGPCKQVTCAHKKYRELPPPPDERILLDLSNLKTSCCDTSIKQNTIEKVEEVLGGMVAKMKFGEDDPCYCECTCNFGFTKKTKYCNVCGGYEVMGEDLAGYQPIELPFPCPIYHNLMDKSKKPASMTSDAKKSSKPKSGADKSVESDKDTKKSKKKKEDKFKFNYGYTAPHIGHSHCTFPCTGTMGQVPRKMGWLWTAENIPGMKFRPLWKPGAVNKYVLRLLRNAKNPGEASKKKRKKDTGKGKRPLKRPLLVVHKKDGEYTVAMETMKTYHKPRAINQVPYEDKPAITYTIGRTEEENRMRRKKKERVQRRLERNQREFIQSAFRDMCQEICLKTYQQALGILPTTEDPQCPCYPADPGPDRTDLDHSCSCSEDSNLTGSDTDSDEWIVEFTPPTATFDPAYKTKKIMTADTSTQYTYLDYRVKLLDRFGNPVPRFFKGPDGSEQCSDLGGFWSPQKKWLEINVDGIIGPDGKWAPNNFIGPNGEAVEAETGKFQAMDGRWLVVGIDGFVDCNSKWRFYPRKVKPEAKKPRPAPARKGPAGDKKDQQLASKKSEATWSCFGDANPKHLSKLGILGHGHDRKLLLETLNKLIAQGEDVKIPVQSFIPRQKKGKGKNRPEPHYAEKKKRFRDDIPICKHATPSDKGVLAVDADGNKTYFRLSNYKNRRPKQRVANLTGQGISVSSFHVPCFHSFISTEVMKKQQYDRLVALAKKRGYGDQATGSNRQARTEPKYRNVIV